MILKSLVLNPFIKSFDKIIRYWRNWESIQVIRANREYFLSFLATSCLYSVVSLGKWSFWKEFNLILFSICFRIFCLKLIDEKAQAVWVDSIEKTFKLAAYPVTHFIPLIFFYTPWKRWKTSGYLMFSGSIERDYWYEMD